MESFVESLERFTPNLLTPEHVRGLSISETSSKFGSLGLYLKIEDLLETNGLSADPELSMALHFALALHADDRRTNGHYADHIMRVGLRLLYTYEITDAKILAAAFLHDAVEDHPINIVKILGKRDEKEAPRDRALFLLGQHFSAEVVDLIDKLSFHFQEDDNEDKHKHYIEYVRNIVESDPRARIIKLSDFIDNAVGNHYTQPPKRQKLDRKYLGLYGVHLKGLFMPDSLVPIEQRDKVAKQLIKAQFRSIGRMAAAS